MQSPRLDEEVIFHVARDIPVPESRRTYLDQICTGDQALRDRVEALLEAHENEQAFLKSDPDAAPTVDHTPLTEHPGTTIGRYKLMEQIGEGGMGTVFVAEQERPIRRKVALKVIKPGMDSKAVVARFEAERQALALMDHPNIAKVLDAGTTDSGRPYFVMELVRGIPITEYCDEHKLTIRERLELFTEVCQAIQHAHQKAIIHRDIKPTNVLVTEQDGKAVPKVIDFGVAKALNQRLTERTIYTTFAQVVGTPLYMSPEQAALSAVDVDTRSDVYSLGVLLYELLTRTTPFDKQRFEQAAYDEIRRIVREEEPPKPSTKISTLGDLGNAVAQKRCTDSDKLGRAVRGDLDWIVMKALEKDRGRRYETASSVAADLGRHLGSEPVEARPPSTIYRLRKFAARHRLVLAVSVSVSLLLLSGLIGMTTLAFRLDQEIRKSNHANQRLTALLDKYRNEQTEAALLLAFSGQLEETNAIATRLEAILEEIDPDYAPGSVSHFLSGIAYFYRGDNRLAREQLRLAQELDPNAVGPNESGSPFAQALTAAATAHAALDSGRIDLIPLAIERAQKAEELARNNPFVLLISLFTYDAAIRLHSVNGLETDDLFCEANDRVSRLAAYPKYGTGRYEIALFLNRNGRRHEALEHYLACGMVRDTCTALEHDGQIDEALAYLDSVEESRYVRMNRLMLEIGRRSSDEILAEYNALVSNQQENLAFRIDALELPLRLGRPDIAAEHAAEICPQVTEYRPIGVWISPLAEYIAGHIDENELLGIAEDHRSRYMRLFAQYWIALKRLSDGNRQGAVEMLQECLKTTAFDYSNYAYAETLLSRLADPAWPPFAGQQ